MWLVVSRKNVLQAWHDPGAAAPFPALSWALSSSGGDFILRLAARRQHSRALHTNATTL